MKRIDDQGSSEYDLLAEIYDVWATADPACVPSRDFYVQLCSETEGSVIEIGVGTGRIAIDVARKHKKIIGLDISSSMLERCQQKAKVAGVLERVKLIQGDIRSPSFVQQAELVVFPFRSIGHLLTLEDKKRVLSEIFNQLAPGGRFVFDHYIFDESWARSHDGVARLMYSHLSDGEGLFIWDTYRYDYANQQMDCFIIVERCDRYGKVFSKTYCPLSFSWIYPEQIRKMALEIGFEVEALYGDFSYSDFNDQSRNQIWFLRRVE
jgi:ubiquinone/menaquinone biosynthesis C-methylase UbiE